MILRLVILCVLFNYVTAQIESIYCGSQTCYEVLGINRGDDKTAVKKAYHKLARLHHPDRMRTVAEKKIAEVAFRKIATAYEILRDSDQRQEYDYMLDNPEQMYYNYYRYYRRRYAAKVDVRLVILAIIAIFSILQYIGQWTSYNQAVNYLVRDPRHRARAKELAIADGRLSGATLRRLATAAGGSELGEDGRPRRLTREQVKQREEAILREVILQTVDLRGDCTRPTVRRTLAANLVFLPYTLFVYTRFGLRWIWLFWLLRRDYGPEECALLTRRRLGLSAAQWDGLPEHRRNTLLAKQLWLKANWQAYEAQQAEELRVRSAENAQEKRYRRYMKRAGPTPIGLDGDEF